jgi:hypothetical protein
MKRLLLLILVGCGGDPFTARQDLSLPSAATGNDASDAVDANGDVVGVDVAMLDGSPPQRDSGSNLLDAGEPDSTGVDANESDSGTETGPVCTPLSGLGACPPSDIMLAIPANFSITNIGEYGPNPQTVYYCRVPTPPQCQCAETYNCACIQAAVGCSTNPYALGWQSEGVTDAGGTTWVSCTQSSGTEVQVTCD